MLELRKNLRFALALMSDSYKLTHWKIYSRELELMYSYLEARAVSDFSDETVFFGLQYLLKSYFRGGVVSIRDLPRIRAFCNAHFRTVGLFNEKGWRYIIEEKAGFLPISIKAVAEGTVMPVSNVMMTIENTDPKCAWLVNFLETVLVQVWNPITVASLSRAMKKNQYRYMKLSVDDDLIPLIMPSRVHDFGFRGVSSPETAAIAGAAHLVNFAGTDTTAGIEMINQFYCGNEYHANMEYDASDNWDEEEATRRWEEYYQKKENMPGFSIPATEHSQMTLGGPAGELAICKDYLEKFPDGYIACVSDSFDLFALINDGWGGVLKEKVLARNGVLVVRPDSGDPLVIVLQVLEALGNKFGYTLNTKGYKVLEGHVRIIQGDGINVQSHAQILRIITDAGWSAENLAFGSGGALLQKVNRDTFAFAFKCCYSVIAGTARDVFKRPKTDPKKNSKRGRLALVRNNVGVLETVPESMVLSYDSGNLLREVFRDGILLVDQNFTEIRELAELDELSTVSV